MDRSEILARLRQSILETTPDINPENVNEDSTLGTLGLDSLRLVELGVRIEQEFSERVSMDAWLDLENAREGKNFMLGSLVDFIHQALQS